MYRLKPEDVKAVVKRLTKVYGCDVVSDPKDPRRRLAHAVLKLARVPAADDFLDNFCFTLPPPYGVSKPTVFLCFRPGSTAKKAPDLVTQLEVIGHEFHHGGRQWPADKVGFAPRYVFDKAQRARIESEALEVDMEVGYFLTDRVPNPGLLALGLAAYGLRKADLRVVEKHLRSKAVTVSHGGVRKHVSKEIIRILKRRATRRRR